MSDGQGHGYRDRAQADADDRAELREEFIMMVIKELWPAPARTVLGYRFRRALVEAGIDLMIVRPDIMDDQIKTACSSIRQFMAVDAVTV